MFASSSGDGLISDGLSARTSNVCRTGLLPVMSKLLKYAPISPGESTSRVKLTGLKVIVSPSLLSISRAVAMDQSFGKVIDGATWIESVGPEPGYQRRRFHFTLLKFAEPVSPNIVDSANVSSNSTVTSLLPAGTLVSTSNMSTASLFQGSAFPPERIRNPSTELIGPVGPCSPGM